MRADPLVLDPAAVLGVHLAERDVVVLGRGVELHGHADQPEGHGALPDRSHGLLARLCRRHRTESDSVSAIGVQRQRIPARATGWPHAPDARHPGDRGAHRRRSGSTRSSGTACASSPTSATGRLRLTSRNENDVTACFPELAGLARRRTTTCCSTARWSPSTAGRPVVRARSPSGCTCSDRRQAARWPSHPAGHVHGLRPAAPRRRRTSPPARWRPRARAARAARPRRRGTGRCPPVVRRRRDAATGHAASRAWRAWSASGASSPLPSRAPLRGLAEARRTAPRVSYVVGGWRPEKTNDRAGSAPCSWGSRPRTGCAIRGRVGSGIAGARAGAGCWSCWRPLRAPTRRRSPTRCPPIDARGTVWVRPEVVVDVPGPWRLTRGRQAAPAGVPRGAHGPESRGPHGGRGRRGDPVTETKVEVAGHRLQAQQPRQGAVPARPGRPRARCSTTTRRSPTCCCRTSRTGR